MSATKFEQDRITIMAPDGTVRVVMVQAAELTIGRKADNTIVLDYADVSPQHARIQFDGTDYRVIDLNSTNGTYMGGVRLLPGVPEVWATDKAVRIGGSWLHLERAKAQTGDVVQASAGAATGGTPPAAVGAPRVAAFVATPDLAVDAGSHVVLTATVLNQGPVVDQLRVSVLDLPAGWLVGPPPVVRLLPGARQPVNLTLAPPRQPESRAGVYPFTIRVSSQEAPNQFADVQVRLTVRPYTEFRSELRPQSVRAGQRAQVHIENRGNTPQTYTLSWHDRAEELAFEPGQCQLSVPEGQTGLVNFRAKARRRVLIGGEKSHAFTAEIASPSGEQQTLAGEVISRALIPRWLPPAVLLPLLAVAAILVALLLQGRRPPTIDSLSVDPLNPVAGQPVTVRWSVKGAETIELRPLVAGIDPTSGQYTFAQGLPAGASLTFVAHNQYGSAEHPLPLSVQNPTPTPTPEPGAPVIKEWSVSPLTVAKGQPVTIRWAVENAETVTLQPIGTVDLSGQMQEKPGQTTRYTLIATNKSKTVERSFEVIVEEPTATLEPTLTPTVGTKIPTRLVLTPIKGILPTKLRIITPIRR